MVSSSLHLEADNILIGYGAHQLIKDFNLTVKPGEFVIMTGHNGIGKSSLLRTLSGMQSPLSGKIIAYKSAFLLETSFPLFNELNVHDNLRFWRHALNATELSIRTAQHDYNLKSLWQVPVALLSDGQRQRVKLSLLTLTSKQLWLIDEPFASLDEVHVALVIKLFQAHCSNGGSIVMTQHGYDAALIPNTYHIDLNQYCYKPIAQVLR